MTASHTTSNGIIRHGLLLCIAMLLNIHIVHSAVNRNQDHLIPVREYYGNAHLYRELWQEKLLVTAGDIARYVHLPSSGDTEAVVSIYLNKEKKDGLPGGYWVTLTEASTALSNYIDEHGVSPEARNAKISRWDAPLPESTGRLIHDLWVSAVSGQRRDECEGCVSTDSSREIFTVRGNGGIDISAQLPLGPSQRIVQLVHLAQLLIDYPRLSVAKRYKLTPEIEERTRVLLKRFKTR
jgi:hypothetical protein